MSDEPSPIPAIETLMRELLASRREVAALRERAEIVAARLTGTPHCQTCRVLREESAAELLR